MAERALREYDGKLMLSRLVPSRLPSSAGLSSSTFALPNELVQIRLGDDLSVLPSIHPWLLSRRLVVKPDQLIKRRGKAGLLKVNIDWAGVVTWVSERMGKSVTVSGVSGELNTFIVEPFVPHAPVDA